MTVSLSVLPLDIFLCISAFLANPLDHLSLSQTCHAAFLASQSYTSYWPTSIPIAHLLRVALWRDYSASELRDACVRYTASQRNWSSDCPTFKLCKQLPFSGEPNKRDGLHTEWRPIRGTQWAWWLEHLTGKFKFFDLRTGLEMGVLDVGSSVSDVIVSVDSPVEWVLCYWRTRGASSYTEPSGAPHEIVSISVSLQQLTTSTQPKMSFMHIARSPIAKWLVFPRSSVQYQGHILNVYSRVIPNSQPAYGIMLWNYKDGSIRYCEMSFPPLRLKVREDILFVIMDIKPGSSFAETCLCIHLPLLIHDAFGDSALPKGATMKLSPYFESSAGEGSSERWFSSSEDIYAIPHDAGTTGPMLTTAYPTYRFILSYSSWSWKIFDVVLDLTVPGPFKPFRSVRHHSTTYGPGAGLRDLDASDGDLLVVFTVRRSKPTLNVRSFSPTLEESDSKCWRIGRVEGLDRMLCHWLYVDRAGGYFLASMDVGLGRGRGRGVRPCPYPFIWWFDRVSSGEDIPAHPQGKRKIVPLGVRSAVSKVFTKLKWRAVGEGRGT